MEETERDDGARPELERRAPRTRRATTQTDLVAIDLARAEAGIAFTPAYQAWLEGKAARS